MRRAVQSRSNNRTSGFSLVELSISLAIFAVIGYGLSGAVQMGQASQTAVANMVAASGDLREANTMLLSELKLAADDNIEVALLPDGNDQLTFMHPIEVPGALGWGVFDSSFGDTTEEQNREDWKIRYTVVSVGQGDTLERKLVRQILDDVGDVQESDVVATGLRDGTGAVRGFSVARAGDMWDIEVALVGATQSSTGKGVKFHVKTRN